MAVCRSPRNEAMDGFYETLLLELMELVKTHFPGIISNATPLDDFSLWSSGC
jgi:hypothetical protein